MRRSGRKIKFKRMLTNSKADWMASAGTSRLYRQLLTLLKVCASEMGKTFISEMAVQRRNDEQVRLISLSVKRA